MQLLLRDAGVRQKLEPECLPIGLYPLIEVRRRDLEPGSRSAIGESHERA